MSRIENGNGPEWALRAVCDFTFSNSDNLHGTSDVPSVGSRTVASATTPRRGERRHERGQQA